MDELQILRTKIDKIDAKMIELFEQRMEIVSQVGRLKQKNQLPVLQTDREREVLERAAKHLKKKEYHESVEKLMIYLMQLSRDEQMKK